MKLGKFARLFGISTGGGIYSAFKRLKINGLSEKKDYNIVYGLHQKHITLTAEGMAMTYYLLSKSRARNIFQREK